MKLASELQKRSTGRTVYVLDEPTTGLHFEDIRKLLRVLDGLVDKGNTVIVIEHNLDVIKMADWIIDMGPGGGHKGGTIVAVGTPEELAETPESYTGEWLRRPLGLDGPAAGGAAATSATGRASRANGTAATKSKPSGANGSKRRNGSAGATGRATGNPRRRAAKASGATPPGQPIQVMCPRRPADVGACENHPGGVCRSRWGPALVVVRDFPASG